MVKTTKRPGTAPESFYTNEYFGTVPRAETTSRGSLDIPKILGTGATLHLGLIRLHVEWGLRERYLDI